MGFVAVTVTQGLDKAFIKDYAKNLFTILRIAHLTSCPQVGRLDVWIIRKLFPGSG